MQRLGNELSHNLEDPGMLITVEGLYKDGHIELLEQPNGVEQARVLVTLLPEAPASSNTGVHKIAGLLADRVSLEAKGSDPVQDILGDLRRERSIRLDGFGLQQD